MSTDPLTDKLTGRQADKLMYRLICRQTSTQADSEDWYVVRQTCKHTDSKLIRWHADRLTVKQTDKQTNRQTQRENSGQADRRARRHTDISVDKQTETAAILILKTLVYFSAYFLFTFFHFLKQSLASTIIIILTKVCLQN